MSASRRLPVMPKLFRSAAVTALLSAALLSTPVTGANAADAMTDPPDTAKIAAPAPMTHKAMMKGESVEQRITSLHKSLKITAAQETDWAAVAQAMRDNVKAMQTLVTAHNAESTKKISAVESLNNYQAFAQAHVDGLKNLIPAFGTLYASMSDEQKATADQVFQKFGHKVGHKESRIKKG